MSRGDRRYQPPPQLIAHLAGITNFGLITSRVLRVHRLGPAHQRLDRDAVALGHLADVGVLARQIVRHASRLYALVADDARRSADRHRVGAQVVGPRQDVGLGQIDRIVHEHRHRQHVPVPPEVCCDGRPVAAGRPIAPHVTNLQVRGRGNQLVAIPHAGGETCLIVRRAFRRPRPPVHPDRHRRASFPGADHPGLHPAGHGVGHGPHPQAEGSGRDVPLGLEPADALGLRDHRLVEPQRFRAARFVERQTGPVGGVGTSAALQRVLVVDRHPRSRQIDLGACRQARARQQRQDSEDSTAAHDLHSPADPVTTKPSTATASTWRWSAPS